MKILLTGSAGQIACGLIPILHKDGHKLVFVDPLSGGSVENMKIDGKIPGPHYNVGAEDEKLANLLSNEEEGFDAIIHLGAISALPDCESNPVEAIKVNVLGTANLLKYARKRGIPKFIFASTSAVYENNESEILTEDLEINPRLHYPLSKKICEELIMSYRQNYGMDITTLRFFNVFGPNGDRVRKHPPIMQFLVTELLKGTPPELSGDGEQRRDFVHADDVIKMLNLCLTSNANDTFNVCTGKNISINQMGKWVAEALGCEDIGLAHKPATDLWSAYPEMFQGTYPLSKDIVARETLKFSRGSYEKAKKLLGWEPNTDMEMLVKKTARELAEKINFSNKGQISI